MNRFSAEQGMVGTKRMDNAGLADRHTCYGNSTRIATHFVPTSLFPTPIMDASHVSAQNASCSIPGRVHTRFTYPFLQKANVTCCQDAATNTASNTQDKNSVPLYNLHPHHHHKHHPNTLLEHCLDTLLIHHPNPLHRLSQTTRLHNTPSTREMQSKGIFPFSRTNVLEKGKTQASIPQQIFSAIFMGIFPDIFMAIIPSILTDIRHDMEWLSSPTTDSSHTTSVFAIHGLHVFVSLNYKYGTSDRTYTTTTVTVAYYIFTKTVENDIMHFNASSSLLSSRLADPEFPPFYTHMASQSDRYLFSLLRDMFRYNLFCKSDTLNLSQQHGVVVPVAPRLATFKMNK